MQDNKVVLFGGNGFVGTAIAKELVLQNLVHQNITPVCVSRTGTMPVHLQNEEWAKQAAWVKGDALSPDPAILQEARAVVALVGSPPVPTFSNNAYSEQLSMNSEPNLAVIDAVSKSEVPRLVLLGAHMPKLIQSDKFAYAKGKRLCEAAARRLVEESDRHSAVLLKPSGIYGTRHTQNGKPINIASVMRPIAGLQKMMPGSLRSFLPETLVSVSAVADAAVNACLDSQFDRKFTVITNQQIIDYA